MGYTESLDVCGQQHRYQNGQKLIESKKKIRRKRRRKNHVSGVKCVVSGVRCQVSDVRCQVCLHLAPAMALFLGIYFGLQDFLNTFIILKFLVFNIETETQISLQTKLSTINENDKRKLLFSLMQVLKGKFGNIPYILEHALKSQVRALQHTVAVKCNLCPIWCYCEN